MTMTVNIKNETPQLLFVLHKTELEEYADIAVEVLKQIPITGFRSHLT
jgi:hypothetical protein